jgi:hypothetical protein
MTSQVKVKPTRCEHCGAYGVLLEDSPYSMHKTILSCILCGRPAKNQIVPEDKSPVIKRYGRDK